MEHILEYENLVNKIASKYSSYSSFEDLKQVGMIGLLKAIDKYEANSNTKFSTYAYMWIKGEILEYLRCDKSIKISKEMLALSKEVIVCQEILRSKLNKEPTISEIAFFLEKDEHDIVDAIMSRNYVLSCDYVVNEEDEGKNVSLYDAIPYYENGYDAQILDLHTALENLTEEERKIIQLRYYDDMTQSEVSKKLGCNQVSVSRSEAKILEKLNKSLVA